MHMLARQETPVRSTEPAGYRSASGRHRVPFQASAKETSPLAVGLRPTATHREGPLHETAVSALARFTVPLAPGTRWPSQRWPSQASATGNSRACDTTAAPTATQYRALAHETSV